MIHNQLNLPVFVFVDLYGAVFLCSKLYTRRARAVTTGRGNGARAQAACSKPLGIVGTGSSEADPINEVTDR